LLEKLSLGSDYLRRECFDSEARASLDEDFRISFEDETIDPSEDSPSPPEPGSIPADYHADDAFFTCHESGSEIDAREVEESDDDWTQWDSDSE
jgi:hypothetical protein